MRLHSAALDAARRSRSREAHAPVLARRGDDARRCPAACALRALSIRIRMICATRSGSQERLDRLAANAQLQVRVVRGERRQELRGDGPRELARRRSARGAARASRPPGARGPAGPSRACRSRSTCSRSWSRKRRARLVVEVLVLQQLEEAAEREDRRAQLVRRGGDEALARASSSCGELALHVVERCASCAELVLAVDREARARSRRRRRAGRRSPCARTRPPSERADEERGEHREGQRDDRGDDDPRAHEVDAALARRRSGVGVRRRRSRRRARRPVRR